MGGSAPLISWALRRHQRGTSKKFGLEPRLAELARYAAWFVAPIAILNCALLLAGLLGSLSQNQSHHRKCGVLLIVDCSLLALGVWSGKFGGLVVAGTATSVAIRPKAFGCGGGARGLGQTPSELQ